MSSMEPMECFFSRRRCANFYFPLAYLKICKKEFFRFYVKISTGLSNTHHDKIRTRQLVYTAFINLLVFKLTLYVLKNISQFFIPNVSQFGVLAAYIGRNPPYRLGPTELRKTITSGSITS
jgi:hypothetical protein